jgi:hypothetical protein
MDIRPSREAIESARLMGTKAAEEDTWFFPCPEQHLEEGDTGSISEAHKDSWCQTAHFHIFYGDRLTDLTDDEEERISGSVGGLNHLNLARYEGLYIPLRDAFFEAWEEASGFYPKLQAALAKSK